MANGPQNLPPLPLGFVLDQGQSDLPPLPAGFTIDTPTQDTPEINVGAKGDRRAGSRVDPSLMDPALQGVTLGAADEIVSGLQAPVRAGINLLTGSGPQGLSENFQQAQAREAAQIAAAQSESPVLSTAAEVGGSLVAGGPAARLIGSGASLAGNVARGAGVGAGFGAAQGFLTGDGLDDRLQRAKTGAGVGAATGAGGTVLARGADRIFKSYETSKLAKALPTFSNFKKKAQKFYGASERAGVHVKAEALDDFKAIMSNTLAEEEFIPQNFPALTAVLNRMEEVLTFNPSLKRLDKVRGALKKPLSSLEEEDRRMAMIVKSGLDDFINSLEPRHVSSGDPATATKFLNEARKLWAQGSKVETLENIMDVSKRRASVTGSGANIENVIRQEFNKILNSSKLAKGFNQEELDAIRVVVEGTKRGNQLRLAGKAAPTGIVSFTGGTGAGGAIGGTIGGLVAGPAGIPVGAAIGGTGVPAVGALSKSLADRSTMKAAERVMQRVANGGPLMVKTPAQLEQLIRRLVIAQTGQLQPAQ